MSDTELLNLTFFGPGYGECVVLRLAPRYWVIIDSAVDVSTGESLAVRYLKQQNVDLSKDVRLVVATHWHDDHIKGISQVVAQCESATFCCSPALKDREFLTFLSAFDENATRVGSGVRELFTVFRVLREQGRSIARWAFVDRTIAQLTPPDCDAKVEVAYLTVTPSDKQYQKFLDGQKYIHKNFVIAGRAPDYSPNHLSVVSVIHVGNFAAILGADLEEVGDPDLGWSAVCQTVAAKRCRSSVFKVPHHGSENGFCQQVWDALLEPDAISIITPWTKGGNRLPTPEGILQYHSATKNLFMTSGQKLPKSDSKRDPAVERTLREAGIQIFASQPKPGSIRVSVDADCKASVDLAGGATRVSDAARS